jgi:endoglucanase
MGDCQNEDLRVGFDSRLKLQLLGNAWTGAHSWTQNWYGTPNAQEMLNIVDPGNNYAFDEHQYLDSDSSGTSSTIVSATIGQERLVAFTNWLHTNNRRGFLGEFAVANSTIGTGGT